MVVREIGRGWRVDSPPPSLEDYPVESGGEKEKKKDANKQAQYQQDNARKPIITDLCDRGIDSPPPSFKDYPVESASKESEGSRHVSTSISIVLEPE